MIRATLTAPRSTTEAAVESAGAFQGSPEGFASLISLALLPSNPEQGLPMLMPDRATGGLNAEPAGEPAVGLDALRLPAGYLLAGSLRVDADVSATPARTDIGSPGLLLGLPAADSSAASAVGAQVDPLAAQQRERPLEPLLEPVVHSEAPAATAPTIDPASAKLNAPGPVSAVETITPQAVPPMATIPPTQPPADSESQPAPSAHRAKRPVTPIVTSQMQAAGVIESVQATGAVEPVQATKGILADVHSATTPLPQQGPMTAPLAEGAPTGTTPAAAETGPVTAAPSTTQPQQAAPSPIGLDTTIDPENRTATESLEAPLAPTPETKPIAPPKDLRTPAEPAIVRVVQEQLRGPIARMVSDVNGNTLIKVRLHPEELGQVTVKATFHSTGVRIELIPISDAARDTVKATLPELRRDLLAHGSDASLSMGEEETSPQGGRGSRHEQAPPRTSPSEQPAPRNAPQRKAPTASVEATLGHLDRSV